MVDYQLAKVCSYLGDTFVEQLLEFLSKKAKEAKALNDLKDRLVERLSLEKKRYTADNSGLNIDFAGLETTIIDLFKEEKIIRWLTEIDPEKSKQALESMQNQCISISNAKTGEEKNTVLRILDNCLKVVDTYYLDLTDQEKALAAKITRVIEKINNDKFSEIRTTEEKHFREIMDAISKSARTDNNHNHLKSDNAAYLNMYNSPLFLDSDNPQINLENLYISPMVKNNRIKAVDYISEWYRGEEPCLLLYGEAGVGKSSLVSGLVVESNKKIDTTNDSVFSAVLAIALREHVNVFRELIDLDDGYSAKDILIKLFNAQGLEDLENRLLILDGYDELSVLITGFNKIGAGFLNNLNKALSNTKQNIRVLITSRNGYFDHVNIQSDTLCWGEEQINRWCSCYEILKPEKKRWCREFIQQFQSLPRSNEDRRYEILCIPFILYLCSHSEVDLEKNKSVCQIYDQSFRVLLFRKHNDKFIGSERFDENISNKERCAIYWQYTKELAYQMFLLETLDLSDACNYEDKKYIGLQNAKRRTVSILKERYYITISESDLDSTKLLSVFRFAMDKERGGITFAHKSVYEYFTAVKIYEDYFAKYTSEYFISTPHDIVNKDLMESIIEAFRYHSIPEDIFAYLCEMLGSVAIEDDHSNNCVFDYNTFEASFVQAIAEFYDAKFEMKTPILEYLYCSEINMVRYSIKSQIVRAFRNLTWFLTGHGFTGNKCLYHWIASLLCVSDQEVRMSKWNLEQIFLYSADLSYSKLDGTSFQEANITNSFINDSNLAGADFRRANLNFSNLRNSDLSHAILHKTSMKYTNLTSAELEGANMIKADLGHADLSHAEMNQTILLDADLTYSVLHYSHIDNARMENAIFEKANLIHAMLSNTNMSNTNLIGADFENAELYHVNMRNADLRGTNFAVKSIINVDLFGAKYNSKTIFPNSFFPEAYGMIKIDDPQ